jgi:putative ABC transport system permease protein
MAPTRIARNFEHAQIARKESGNRSGTGFRQDKTRSLLVISEISLGLVLLIGSALLIRTLVALREVNPGFGSRNVLTMEMSLNGPRYQNTAGVIELLRDGRSQLDRLAWSGNCGRRLLAAHRC